MSTDYGFGCETCGLNEDDRIAKMVVIDNHRSPEQLAKLLNTPGFFEAVSTIHQAGLQIRPDFEHHYSFDPALAFVIEHRALGHVVRVCDEYGRWENSCYHWVVCGCCGKQQHCSLPHGHDGDHALKAPRLTCPTCKGNGYAPGYPMQQDSPMCPLCNGERTVEA